MVHGSRQELSGLEIAVVGMAGRFPGASSVEQLWRNLQDGKESIVFFDDDELLAAGVDPGLLTNPAYVKARAKLDDVERFDAAFFGLTPREAEILDPQQRLFLEGAWEALETAGCAADRYRGWIGVYAGSAMSSYYLRNLATNPEVIEAVGRYPVLLANDKDFLTTRTSYKLNLRGPSVAVQTACSTSLVAVHLACQALLRGECDLALAGGVSIALPQVSGYLYQEGGILSPDGHCRSFDAAADGCVGGSGCGVVALERLNDALERGSVVHAVIKGTAINNDGAEKVGFTAPQVEGQAKVIRAAQLLAEVDPATITYVEAHGTATRLGDPIEVDGLVEAFSGAGAKTGFCALGSVKSNLGHLDTAAGVTGLIKTVLALEHRQIPATLHFKRPNPRIELAGTPFRVVSELTSWEVPAGMPRRAGVSSFGIGGTNAHAVLEEAPEPRPSGSSRPWQLLLLSARTPTAVERAAENLAAHLERHPQLVLADVAHTLESGRAVFSYRLAVVAHDPADAVAALRERSRIVRGEAGKPQLAFLFPGQGAQHPGMMTELYRGEPVFRREVDECAEILHPHLGEDLRRLLYPRGDAPASAASLDETQWAQPALFTVELALARLLTSWGAVPSAMLGHSLGELVAACLAGVFSREDALRLVALRGRWMQTRPAGAMLAVHLGESEILKMLGTDLALAAINGSQLVTVAGPREAIDALERELAARGAAGRRLHTSHAFHSADMDPVVDAFAAEVAKLRLKPPSCAFISSTTGTWIRPEEAVDPGYWGRQLRAPVRFDAGLRELLARPGAVLLEVGPGTSLTKLAARHPDKDPRTLALATCVHPREVAPPRGVLPETLIRLWVAGVAIDWSAFRHGEHRRLVALPTYPFERRRYWVEPGHAAPTVSRAQPVQTARADDPARWLYRPGFRQAAPPFPARGAQASQPWLVYADTHGVGQRLAARLRARGEHVALAVVGASFERRAEALWSLAPQRRDDHRALLRALAASMGLPRRIVVCWPLSGAAEVASARPAGWYPELLALAQAVGEEIVGRGLTGGGEELELAVVCDGLLNVTGEEMLDPSRALLVGPVRVIPQEYPGVVCRAIDVVAPSDAASHERLVDRLETELGSAPGEPIVALRGAHRWLPVCEPVELPEPAEEALPVRRRGVYVITGGTGGIGLALAEELGRKLEARLVLLARHPPTAEQHARLQALEASGAEVMVATADVADAERMSVVLAEVRQRFGGVHGVFHTAGVAGGAVLQLQTPEVVGRTFAAKVEGTRVIDALLHDDPLELVVLFSSQRALLGGFGRAEYCSANAFLDAFAQARSLRGRVVYRALNWDGWREVGMAAAEAERRGKMDAELQALGLSTTEGLAALWRALSVPLPQLVVSTTDFAAREAEARRATAESALARLEQLRPAVTAHPRPDLSTAYRAPGNPVEQTLATIWSRALGLEQVGVDDSFFELGGDSVLGLQVTAQANQAGLVLAARQLFEHQTIAELAKVAGTGPTIIAGQGLVSGEVPLTPIQSWFFERALEAPHHFNQALLLELPSAADPGVLAAAVAAVVHQHDALRLRFEQTAGGWRQAHAAAPPVFGVVDLSALAGHHRSAAVEAGAASLQGALDLGSGPLVRAALWQLGAAPSRLLLVVHHLLIDMVSWRVVLDDLRAAAAQLSAREPVSLPAKTTAFKHWAERLAAWAQSAELAAELPYWLERPWQRWCPLPVDANGPDTIATAASLTVVLGEGDTRALIEEIPRASTFVANELILGALAQTIAGWSAQALVALDVEGHGREPLFDDVDVSRTVGWFTSLFPLLLDLEACRAASEALKRVKQQLRELPHGGLGFGALRHLSRDPEITARLAALPRREILYLYGGHADDRRAQPGPYRSAAESSGPNQSPHNARSHAIEVTATVSAGRLELSWTWSRHRHHRATIEALAEQHLETLRALIAGCLAGEEAGYTPSDFPEAELDQAELDELLAQLEP